MRTAQIEIRACESNLNNTLQGLKQELNELDNGNNRKISALQAQTTTLSYTASKLTQEDQEINSKLRQHKEEIRSMVNKLDSDCANKHIKHSQELKEKLCSMANEQDCSTKKKLENYCTVASMQSAINDARQMCQTNYQNASASITNVINAIPNQVSQCIEQHRAARHCNKMAGHHKHH